MIFSHPGIELILMKRQVILSLLASAFFWIVITRFTEVKQLRDTLAQG